MKRIYCDEVYKLETEELKEHFLKLYNLAEEAQRCFDEYNYKIFVPIFYNYVREQLNLPNKLFTMAKSEDEVVIVLFPKEPDGNHYRTNYDEEQGLIYVLVD